MVYEPPFANTAAMVALAIEIAEKAAQVEFTDALSPNPRLRRATRIQTIHSSLVIENNALTLDEVTAVLDGKQVLAPLQDVLEVQNAYRAYGALDAMDPYSLEDLLRAHRLMTDGLIREAGQFRSGDVGVFAGNALIHAGTPASYVPEVMADLFHWLRESSDHPLIKGCVFHFEFEFIHPFADGNGRTGRMWHSLLLRRWRPVFAWMPIETLVHHNQQEYYDALACSGKDGDATHFTELMLRIIRDALDDVLARQRISARNEQASDVDDVNNGVRNGARSSSPFGVALNDEELLLDHLRLDSSLTVREMAERLGKSPRQVQRIIARLKEQGRLERVGPNKGGSWRVH